MLCTKKKYVNPFVFYWSNVTHTLKTVGMMCWQDCWGCDGPGSFHILVWTKELKLMARWGTQTWINVQGSLFWTGVLSLTPVRSGRTWRTTSRRPLRMNKLLLEPNPKQKLIFSSVQFRYGGTAVRCRLALFLLHPPRYTSHSRHRKIKNKPCIFSVKSLFPLYSLLNLRSESSWLEPSESPSPPSSAPTAARRRRPKGHRWQWPSRKDGRIESPSSGQSSPFPESPPPAEWVRKRREEDTD